MPGRCEMDGCKKRLELTAFPCRCKKTFCTAHRTSCDHACTFDYKAEQTTQLLKTMSTAVVGEKLARV
jgi:hypothetical protein